MTEPVKAYDYLQGIKDGYHAGYANGLQDGLAQGPNHPAVIESVKRIFGDWTGAKAARARSAERFKQQHGVTHD